MMTYEDLTTLAGEAVAHLKAHNLKLATAESCTGGLIAALITEIPGSSVVLERGFVTYSNAAKQDMLGVSRSLLEQYGAVSREVAEAMAEGALTHSRADVAISVTGIAGPDGGSTQKPTGLVHFCLLKKSGFLHLEKQHFKHMDRHQVRFASAALVLRYCMKLI
jgi:nicotinamide-nucleotide amidase